MVPRRIGGFLYSGMAVSKCPDTGVIKTVIFRHHLQSSYLRSGKVHEELVISGFKMAWYYFSKIINIAVEGCKNPPVYIAHFVRFARPCLIQKCYYRTKTDFLQSTAFFMLILFIANHQLSRFRTSSSIFVPPR